jgi:hypothetical protein
MEGGIVILLILIIVVGGGLLAMFLTGAGGLAESRSGRAGRRAARPQHTRVHDDPDEDRGRGTNEL